MGQLREAEDRSEQGTFAITGRSGKNKIRVVVDNKTGNIITVTKG